MSHLAHLVTGMVKQLAGTCDRRLRPSSSVAVHHALFQESVGRELRPKRHPSTAHFSPDVRLQCTRSVQCTSTLQSGGGRTVSFAKLKRFVAGKRERLEVLSPCWSIVTPYSKNSRSVLVRLPLSPISVKMIAFQR